MPTTFTRHSNKEIKREEETAKRMRMKKKKKKKKRKEAVKLKY